MWKHNQRLTLLIEDLLSLSQIESRQAAGLHFERVESARLPGTGDRTAGTGHHRKTRRRAAGRCPRDLPPDRGGRRTGSTRCSST